MRTDGRCPECMGPDGLHYYLHIRHDNGGGHNEPCPLRNEGDR